MKNIIFIAIVFAYVLDVIRPQTNFGLVGLTLQNIVIYISLLILTVEAVMIRGDRRKAPPLLLAFSVAGFITMNLLYSHFFGKVDVDISDNLRKVKSLVFDTLVLYVIAFMLVSSITKGRQYLFFVVAVISALNIFTLLAARFGLDFFSVAEHYREKDRFVGLAGNPNKTSYILCVLIPFQYYFFKTSRSFSVRLSMPIFIVIQCFTIMFTGSRGGLFCLCLVFGGLAYIYKDYKKLIILPFFLLPPLVIWFVASGNEYLAQALDRILLLVSSDSSVATSGRLDIWGNLIEIWSSDATTILFGTGFGSSEYIGQYIRAHNLYVQVLVELGLLGFIFWMYALRRVWLAVARNRQFELLQFKQVVLLTLLVVCCAWLFTSLIGILQLISFIISLGAASVIQSGNFSRSPGFRN